MDKYKIFIVEDDRTYGEMLKYYLSMNEDYEIYLKTWKGMFLCQQQKPKLMALLIL